MAGSSSTKSPYLALKPKAGATLYFGAPDADGKHVERDRGFELRFATSETGVVTGMTMLVPDRKYVLTRDR